MDHMGFLEDILKRDLVTLRHKEATYNGSWKKRGGSGAFMVTARKWDRLENICTKHAYNIFKAIGTDMSGADGSALAEVRDLRQYLALIEAEMLSRGVPVVPDEKNIPGTPEDGGHHSRHKE
jgi:hypothetical protein